MGFDHVADALGDQTRRQILVELLEHNPVTVTNAHDSDHAEVMLRHNHLPKLDKMGYIVWNRNEGTIMKGPNWEEIQAVVRLLSNNRECIPNDTFKHMDQS